MKDYKAVWDNLSNTFAGAGYVVCLVDDEDEIRRRGDLTATFLKEVLQIGPDDRVLEIGCGVARIGRELAPMCGEWHGCDISGNMIAHARERTQGISNVYLHELPDSTLGIFSDGYFDCVYCTIVFMHLDKPDVFSYIREAYRVLRPGGRAYFDTYNLLAPEAWSEFLKITDTQYHGKRPPYMSQFSTPQEMSKYLEEAGFTAVHVDGENNPKLVLALGQKPEAEHAERPATALRDGYRSHPAPAAVRDEHTAAPGNGNVQAGLNAAQLDLHRMEKRLREQEEMLVGQGRYLRELEEAIVTKNRHIARLERLISKQERTLASLPVRLALRVRQTVLRKR